MRNKYFLFSTAVSYILQIFEHLHALLHEILRSHVQDTAVSCCMQYLAPPQLAETLQHWSEIGTAQEVRWQLCKSWDRSRQPQAVQHQNNLRGPIECKD